MEEKPLGSGKYGSASALYRKSNGTFVTVEKRLQDLTQTSTAFRELLFSLSPIHTSFSVPCSRFEWKSTRDDVSLEEALEQARQNKQTMTTTIGLSLYTDHLFGPSWIAPFEKKSSHGWNAYDVQEWLVFLYCMTKFVSVLQSNGCSHEDLNPGNLLRLFGEKPDVPGVGVIDFGFSRVQALVWNQGSYHWDTLDAGAQDRDWEYVCGTVLGFETLHRLPHLYWTSYPMTKLIYSMLSRFGAGHPWTTKWKELNTLPTFEQQLTHWNEWINRWKDTQERLCRTKEERLELLNQFFRAKERHYLQLCQNQIPSEYQKQRKHTLSQSSFPLYWEEKDTTRLDFFLPSSSSSSSSSPHTMSRKPGTSSKEALFEEAFADACREETKEWQNLQNLHSSPPLPESRATWEELLFHWRALSRTFSKQYQVPDLLDKKDSVGQELNKWEQTQMQRTEQVLTSMINRTPNPLSEDALWIYQRFVRVCTKDETLVKQRVQQLLKGKKYETSVYAWIREMQKNQLILRHTLNLWTRLWWMHALSDSAQTSSSLFLDSVDFSTLGTEEHVAIFCEWFLVCLYLSARMVQIHLPEVSGKSQRLAYSVLGHALYVHLVDEWKVRFPLSLSNPRKRKGMHEAWEEQFANDGKTWIPDPHSHSLYPRILTKSARMLDRMQHSQMYAWERWVNVGEKYPKTYDPLLRLFQTTRQLFPALRDFWNLEQTTLAQPMGVAYHTEYERILATYTEPEDASSVYNYKPSSSSSSSPPLSSRSPNPFSSPH